MSFQNLPNHKLATESFTNKGARQASEMLKKIPNTNNQRQIKMKKHNDITIDQWCNDLNNLVKDFWMEDNEFIITGIEILVGGVKIDYITKEFDVDYFFEDQKLKVQNHYYIIPTDKFKEKYPALFETIEK